MTTSSHEKAFTQLNNKPTVKQKFIKHNTPKKRKCGIGVKKCKRCGRNGAHISMYNLGLCRQCFRDIAPIIGFKKFN